MIAAILRHILRAVIRLDRRLWRDIDAEIRTDEIAADEYDAMAGRQR
jgi:hypothetical protein